jgi:cytidyltransferase-like protein
MTKKKVFVSSCFDMLHSGHIRFLEKAATFGDVYLALGSDRTLTGLKGRAPVTTEQERKYMLDAVRHVKRCVISHVTELLDRLGDEYPSIRVAHGEADLLAGQIPKLRQKVSGSRQPLPTEVTASFSKAVLLSSLIATLEKFRSD